jgi:Protein of unknown function (DUF2815)
MSSVFTPNSIIAFANIDTPRPKQEGGEPVFGAVFLIDPRAQQSAEWHGLQKAAREAAVKKFGDKAKNPDFMRGLRMPFRDAGEKAQWSGFKPGWRYISASSKSRPGVAMLAEDGSLVEVHDIKNTLFSGCLVRASVGPFGYDRNGNRGVSFGLNNLVIISTQKPRLDGRRDVLEEFAGQRWMDQDQDEEENAPV